VTGDGSAASPLDDAVSRVENTMHGIAHDAAVSHAELLRRDIALDAVRRLHSPRSFSGDGYGWTVCAEDRQQWPCATERAIQEAMGDA